MMTVNSNAIIMTINIIFGLRVVLCVAYKAHRCLYEMARLTVQV